MVHALQEVWRVLIPHGILIDMRPICVDVPLYILTTNRWKSAGFVDRGQERANDIASDRAIRRVIHDGLIKRIKCEYFNLNYYWTDLNELKIDVEGAWKEDVILSKENWERAQQLFAKGTGQDRVRIPIRMKISKYQKEKLAQHVAAATVLNVKGKLEIKP